MRLRRLRVMVGALVWLRASDAIEVGTVPDDMAVRDGRRIATIHRGLGYRVDFREFDGDREMPPETVTGAMATLLRRVGSMPFELFSDRR